MLHALACHPRKSVFCTVGDDTFMNIYEVQGETSNLSIDVRVSSQVKDLMLVGV